VYQELEGFASWQLYPEEEAPENIPADNRQRLKKRSAHQQKQEVGTEAARRSEAYRRGI